MATDEYDDEGNLVYVEIPGGGRENAIGLDCGQIAIDLQKKKFYYSMLFEKVQYEFEMTNMYVNFSNGGSYYNRDQVGKIVGFSFKKGSLDEKGNFQSDYTYNGVLFNNVLYEKAESIEPAIYTFFIAPMPKDRSTIEKLVNIHYDENEDRGFSMQNSATYLLDMVGDLLDVLGTVFLYVGLGLAIFSMLLMSNYIAVSISYKKREIGILRAVGAKSSDVFSIFFSESLIIALINFFLSMIVSGVGCMLLNNMMRKDYGIQITLLN